MDSENPLESKEFTGEDGTPEDVKEFPIIPPGTYTGVVVGVGYNADLNSLDINVNLSDNEGNMVIRNSNGELIKDEASVNGETVKASQWLPNKGDKDLVKEGKKRSVFESKMYFFGKQMDALGITWASITDVIERGKAGEFSGIPVSLTVVHTPDKTDPTKIYTNVNSLVVR